MDSTSSTTQQGICVENICSTAVSFDSISRTIEINNKYGQYYKAAGNKFREHAVAFENIYIYIYRALDFQNIGSA